MFQQRLQHQVRLGVLTNPIAKHNHRFPLVHKDLVKRLGKSFAVLTATKAEIEGAIGHLIGEAGVNVLAINGGDGTIHSAINALRRLCAEGLSSPVLLLLNGGTYNMASRAFGTKSDPVGTVTRFLRRFGDAKVQDVPTRDLGLLEIRPEGKPEMLGMVFGSEVVANALDLCDRLGSGYLGLARLFAKGVVGYALRTRFYRENSHLLRPKKSFVEVDGQGFDEVVGAVASTIDLMLARGLIWSLTVLPREKGFHAKVVRGKSPGEVVRLLPHLLFELQHPMVITLQNAQCLRTWGRFTVDGELFAHEGPVEVRTSPFRFKVVSGEDF